MYFLSCVISCHLISYFFCVCLLSVESLSTCKKLLSAFLTHSFDPDGGYNGKLDGICGISSTLKKKDDPKYIPTVFEQLAVDKERFNEDEMKLLWHYLKEKEKVHRPDFEGDLSATGLWHPWNSINGNNLEISFLHQLSLVTLHLLGFLNLMCNVIKNLFCCFLFVFCLCMMLRKYTAE